MHHDTVLLVLSLLFRKCIPLITSIKRSAHAILMKSGAHSAAAASAPSDDVDIRFRHQTAAIHRAPINHRKHKISHSRSIGAFQSTNTEGPGRHGSGSNGHEESNSCDNTAEVHGLPKVQRIVTPVSSDAIDQMHSNGSYGMLVLCLWRASPSMALQRPSWQVISTRATSHVGHF